MASWKKLVAVSKSAHLRRQSCFNALFGRVHQIELGLVLHKLGFGRVVPNCLDGDANLRIDVCLGTRLGLVFEEELGLLLVPISFWLNVELLHSRDDSFSAFHQVLKYGRPVVVQLVFGISFQMYDLHLLDDC